MEESQVYAETSFLMSYFIEDEHTERARFEVSALDEPILISMLCRLEYHNSVWRKVGHAGFKREHAEEAVREFEEQTEKGWFPVVQNDPEKVWKRAMGLVTLYSSDLKVRSLDIMHVAEGA